MGSEPEPAFVCSALALHRQRTRTTSAPDYIMRIHFKTLGCRLNEAETEAWRRDFLAKGHRDTDQIEEADLVVINSCAVTEEAVRKSRKLVRRAQRGNPQAKLVLSGCYATLDSDAAAADLGIDLLVENRDKHRLAELVSESLSVPAMPAAHIDDNRAPLLPAGRQRAFVKVQDGCRYRCTFCIVTVARGEERSRPIGDIIGEVNHLHAEGVREIVMTGVHLGGYGTDSGSDIGRLIERVLAETDMPRIRMGSLEPWDIPEHFWTLFDNPRLMPHLHLPLQSGCDRTLRRMARRCKTAEFSALVEHARQAVPRLNITTDIIVGFPGESEADWRESLDFIAATGFGHIHIFSYSPRGGTKAATQPEQLPRVVKRQRSEMLHALAADMKRRVQQRHLGERPSVLVEAAPLSTNQNRYAVSGYTPNFLRVGIAGLGPEQANQIIQVELSRISPCGGFIEARPLPADPENPR